MFLEHLGKYLLYMLIGDFVRENSEAADVEPDFRMLDQFELDDICDSALADVFNKHYVDSDRDFLDVLLLVEVVHLRLRVSGR